MKFPRRFREIGIISIILIVAFSYGLYFLLQDMTEDSIKQSLFEQQRHRQLDGNKAVSQHIVSDIGSILANLKIVASSVYVQQGNLTGDKTEQILGEVYNDIRQLVGKTDILYILDKNDIIRLAAPKNDVKYLLIDECEKMSKSDQNVLLNLLETGILTSTKMKKTAEKKMEVWVFATTNDIDAISRPFRSRFIELNLPGYNFDEFCEIAVKLTERKDGHNKEIAMKIADTVWNKLNSRDVRDILQISKLTTSIDDVEFLANILQKYKKKKECKD